MNGTRKTSRQPDVEFNNHGSIISLLPLSHAAKAWIDDYVKFWTRARPGVSIWTPKLPWNDQVPPPGVTRFGKWAKLLRFLGVEE